MFEKIMVQCSKTIKPCANRQLGKKDAAVDHKQTAEALPLKLTESLAERKLKEKLRLFAIITCLISVIVNLIMCIIAFTFAAIRKSPAIFAFGADCMLDLLSSVIVIWRYFGSSYSAYYYSREIKACVSLGILFICAGVGVILASIYFLYLKELPRWFPVLIVIAGIACGTCFVIGVIKYILFRKLNSEALFLDALNSILSGLFALVIIVSDVVYLYYKSIWYLDPILSIILCLGLITIGSRTIFTHWRYRDYEDYDSSGN